jgi:hypothetical protein
VEALTFERRWGSNFFFLDNRLRDGGEVVSLTRWQPFTSTKIHGIHFCYRLSRSQGHSAALRIRSIEKSSDLIGNQTHHLPACSRVPQPTTLPHAPLSNHNLCNSHRERRFMILCILYVLNLFCGVRIVQSVYRRALDRTACVRIPRAAIFFSSPHSRDRL